MVLKVSKISLIALIINIAYICHSFMQKTVKHFFVFSLLLIFLSNVSGISVCLEHAKHSTSKSTEKKNSKEEKGDVFSQDDQCQCALHLQMNTSLIPDIQNVDFALQNIGHSVIPHPKAVEYRRLIDYFSSRAPPYFS